MRELVYLSDRKLEQFVLDKPRRWWRPAEVEGELRVPTVGGIKVTHRGDELARDQHLERVIASLERSARAARWYTEQPLWPGQWVHFEARLNYTVLTAERFRGLVLFLSPGPGDDAGVRLLLHGSSRHLLGQAPGSAPENLLPYAPSGTGPDAIAHLAMALPKVRNLMRVGDELTRINDGTLADQETLLAKPVAETRPPDWFERAMRTVVVDGLDRQLSPLMAAWMAGYARVTATVPTETGRLLIATPLYVEHIGEPDPA